jgi:hypothetical protein
MPTEYTSNIYDGKKVSGKDFLLDCARAFGACITTMRDDSPDAEIPEEFKPSTYYAERKQEAIQELEKYSNMSLEDAERLAEIEYQQNENSRLKSIEESNKRKRRYQKVLSEVKKWVPPTDEHIHLKEFAIEQLTGSINFDCNTSYLDKPCVKLSPRIWLDNKVAQAIENIEYHKKNQEEENERASGRTEWIKQLRNSL